MGLPIHVLKGLLDWGLVDDGNQLLRDLTLELESGEMPAVCHYHDHLSDDSGIKAYKEELTNMWMKANPII